jgi:single-strand DNA-binding protein
MVGSVNRAIILGNVGQAPELRRTQDGKPVATFNVATTERWKSKDGEKQEKTSWHRVVVFNERLCEVVEKYVHKGSKLFIEGAMHTRSWKGRDGETRYVTEVVLQGFNAQLVLLDKREGVPAAESADEHERPAKGSEERVSQLGFDAEIPF